MNVLITGIGLNSGLGKTREETWSALREGRSAARRLEALDLAADWRNLGSEVINSGQAAADFGLGPMIGCPSRWTADPRNPERDRALSLLEHALDEAIVDANSGGAGPLISEEQDKHRLGVLVGLSKGVVRNLGRVERLSNRLRSGFEEANRSPLAAFWSGSGPQVGAAIVSNRLGARGPCLAPIAACSTGLVAALQGAELIRRGTCDLAIVGAADASLNPFLLGAFRRMRALARDLGGDPAALVCPWDRKRSGFVVGEGAALLVLESESHANARGARPYAEFSGGALGSDAHHETDLNPDPANLALWIQIALDRSSTSAAEIDYINVHGTATRGNDPLECRAIRQALGRQADRLACSANKAQIGHLLGASGAAELAITCLALRDRFVPPTLNLTDQDPACDLDGTPLTGSVREINTALKLSLGFGGHLAAAVLRRPKGCQRESNDV